MKWKAVFCLTNILSHSFNCWEFYVQRTCSYYVEHTPFHCLHLTGLTCFTVYTKNNDIPRLMVLSGKMNYSLVLWWCFYSSMEIDIFGNDRQRYALHLSSVVNRLFFPRQNVKVGLNYHWLCISYKDKLTVSAKDIHHILERKTYIA